MIVAAGSTDVTTYFLLTDPVTGGAATGVTISDLDLVYVRDRAPATKNDAAELAAADSAHADNEAKKVDSTNAPGLYRVDWPDAAFAGGASKVQLYVRDGSGNAAIVPACMEVTLDAGSHVLAENVDSTGTETVTAKKALEAILAVVGGDSAHAEATGVTEFYGRDGSTAIVTNTVADVGDRVNSGIS